jgi:hypothetical protein
MFETKFAEKIKTRILCSKSFLFENRAVLLDDVEKYGTGR